MFAISSPLISDRLQLIVTHKKTFWSANYSACVVYTKTTIHLSVGESDGYLSITIHGHFSE